MRAPLIHIGYPRTGTTWLQKMLFASPPFAPLGGKPKALGLRMVYGTKWLRDPLDFDPEAIRAIHAATPCGNDKIPVISDEGLCGKPIRGGIDSAEIASRIFTCFPEAKILITVREQASHTKSLYDLWLRAGGRCSLKAFITPGEEYRVPLFRPDCLRYDRLARHYATQYGAENVLVLPLEALAQDTAGYLAALGRFVGAEIPVPAAPPANPTDHRRSWLRRYIPDRNTNAAGRVRGFRVPRRIHARLALLVPRRIADRSHKRALAFLRQTYGDRFADSNRALQAFTPFDLAALGYPITPASESPA